MVLDLENVLGEVADDLAALFIPTEIETIDKPVTLGDVFSFYRTFIQKNVPVKIRGCMDDWPALTRWQSDDYLLSKLDKAEVTVAITPNGFADAICGDKFTLPYETKTHFRDFLGELKAPQENRVLYLQQQNNSFNTEFSDLLDDIDTDLQWASQAFGTQLDAINFWMGDGRAISSLHKDPYENIYCVVRGCKKFTLFPPVDRVHLRYRQYPAWRYDQAGQLVKEKDLATVPWIDINQRDPLLDPEEKLGRAHPVVVTVNAGETLYLPSYWFHHVQQSHATIAVNYWYDIDYGPAFGLYSTIDSIVKAAIEGPSEELQ